jgi:hypothetical protein
VAARRKGKIFTERLHGGATHSAKIAVCMYARTLRKAAHVRRFTITTPSTSGWEVRDEQDSRLIRSRLYHDWHRVERARLAFAMEAAGLRDSGWDEQS